MYSRLLIPLILVVLLTGACALSPQSVTISPVLDPASNTPGERRGKISLGVNDNRDNKVIGSRGGVYSETALISAARGMTSEVADRLEEALTELGFEVTRGNDTVGLTVNVNRLEYTAERKTAIYAVSTTASVRVICRNNRNTLTNDYTISDRKEYIKTPTRSENEVLINSTLSSAINRLFQDDLLLDCLEG